MQAEKSDYNMEDSLAQHLNTLAFKLALTVEERKVIVIGLALFVIKIVFIIISHYKHTRN